MFTTRRHNYKTGSVLIYDAFGGCRRTVRVTEKDRNIKNGRPGFSGIEVHPTTLQPLNPNDTFGGVWGYDHQIIRVIAQ